MKTFGHMAKLAAMQLLSESQAYPECCSAQVVEAAEPAAEQY